MIIAVDNLTKKYHVHGRDKTILDAISFELKTGDRVALVGPSGCGKTTLLNILCALDTDYEGTVSVDGRDLKKLKVAELALFRNELIGYVFQEYALIETSTALQNINIPLLYSSVSKNEKKQRLEQAVLKTHCAGYLKRKVNTLSGGERQRVAIARAYVNNPKIFVADEPIGSVDDALSKDLTEVIIDNNPSEIIILSTHQLERVTSSVNRVLRIENGKLFED